MLGFGVQQVYYLPYSFAFAAACTGVGSFIGGVVDLWDAGEDKHPLIVHFVGIIECSGLKDKAFLAHFGEVPKDKHSV